MDHIREGKRGARSTKQAVAIGLSKARRAGVNLPPPKEGKAQSKTRQQAARDYQKGQESPKKQPAQKRSRPVQSALKREGKQAASRKTLSRQASSSARSGARQIVKPQLAKRSERGERRVEECGPEGSAHRQRRTPNDPETEIR
jgi:hypothetical protein